jgi:hypothetical protein
MSGLVSELQKACLDSNVRTAEVLQKAYVVARKLGIKEFEDWVSKEINGYQSADKIADYRFVTGQVKVWNPYHGWIPVIADDPKSQAVLNNRPSSQPLGSLEDALVRSGTGNNLVMTFTPERERDILGENSLYANPKLHLSPGVVQGIVDKVRHIVLRWCLDLEAKGIVGEGMTFSEQEKKAAESAQNIQVHYHGNVSQSQVANLSCRRRSLRAGLSPRLTNRLGTSPKGWSEAYLSAVSCPNFRQCDDNLRFWNSWFPMPNPTCAT